MSFAGWLAVGIFVGWVAHWQVLALRFWLRALRFRRYQRWLDRQPAVAMTPYRTDSDGGVLRLEYRSKPTPHFAGPPAVVSRAQVVPPRPPPTTVSSGGVGVLLHLICWLAGT